MKKIITLILSVILIVSACILPVSAAGTGTLGMTGATGKQGDTVTLSVNLNQNPGLITMKFSISYDSDLTLTKVSNAGLLGGWTTPSPTISSPYTIRWADSLSTVNNTKTGKILTLTFKISDTAAVGNKTVTLNFLESRDADGRKNTFSGASATVKVNCKSHTYGDYVKVSDSKHERECSACGATESKSHNWNSGTVTKPASCKEAGTRERTCTDCGAKKTENIAKTTDHKYGSWSQTKPSGCTEKGSESRTCSVCGKVESRSIAAAGHKFSAATVTKQPTCTEKGEKSGKCTVCGKTTTQSIAATGHKYGAWQTDKQPTCTEKGEQSHKCSVCQKVEKKSVDALGHKFAEPTVTKQPTLSEAGEMSGECEHCGEKTSEVIPPCATDEQTGVTVTAPEGTFAAGTELKVEELTTGKEVEGILSAGLGDIAQKYGIYRIGFTDAEGVSVIPGEKVQISIPLFDGLADANTAVYLAADSGALTAVDFAIVDGKAVITAAGGTYVLAEKATAPSVSSDVGTPDDGDPTPENATWIWLVIAAAVVIIGASAFIIIKRRNR